MKRDDHAGSRPALEHLAGIGADELKILDPFHPHLRRQDLDDHTREIFRKGLSDGLSALVLRHRLYGLAWRRRQSVASERQVENRKRQLGVVFR